MLKLIMFIAALPLIPVALAHGPSTGKVPAISAKDQVRCEIRARDMPGGVRLEGVVQSGRKLSGSYEFQVSKRGAGGTSSSMQSGEFDTSSKRESIVGEVGLGLERGAAYTAELTISWRGGETACVRRHPDRV